MEAENPPGKNPLLATFPIASAVENTTSATYAIPATRGDTFQTRSSAFSPAQYGLFREHRDDVCFLPRDDIATYRSQQQKRRTKRAPPRQPTTSVFSVLFAPFIADDDDDDAR